jgi:peroxiredoxin (alkyl hydroperoxide reductase subunit C)
MFMVNLHDDAPPFSLVGVQSGIIRRFSLREFRGRWLILFFYPADFTFVCLTEVCAFQARLGEIQSLGAEVIGISVDDEASHKAWAEELGGIRYPLLAARPLYTLDADWVRLVERVGHTLTSRAPLSVSQ